MPAGSGVADGVNKNWLNGVGDPASGCEPTRHNKRLFPMAQQKRSPHARPPPGNTNGAATTNSPGRSAIPG